MHILCDKDHTSTVTGSYVYVLQYLQWGKDGMQSAVVSDLVSDQLCSTGYMDTVIMLRSRPGLGTPRMDWAFVVTRMCVVQTWCKSMDSLLS